MSAVNSSISENENLLEVINLVKYFPVTSGLFQRKVADVKAVDGVSFNMKRGQTFGLVGESGCGKTTTARCIIQLEAITTGEIIFLGKDLSEVTPKELRSLRREMQMIFQDPFASLDPRMTAGDIIGEPLLVYKLANGGEYHDRVAELMQRVELMPYMADRFAHEFSGGQRQRIGIARALALNPSLILCDEPVSALDVSIQAQIISLLERLRDKLGLTYLFIAHDLAVVRHISDRVAVMYLGKIVEVTDSDELYDKPLHPYTKALLSAVPVPDPIVDRQRSRIILEGDVPSPIDPPAGCNFHPRCPAVMPMCRDQEPEGKDVSGDHWVSCHLY